MTSRRNVLREVPAAVSYQIEAQPGPYEFELRGVMHEIQSGSDAVVIVKVVTSPGAGVIGRQIVGVIGDRGRNGTIEFLNLFHFLRAGGFISLSKDLDL